MELLLGSHVRELGDRVGRLAGFELEPATRRLRRIIFSADGNLGPQASMRPIAAVTHVHDNGEVELRADIDVPPMPVVSDVILLSRATRLARDGRAIARVVGVAVDVGDHSLTAVLNRSHWWSRRHSWAASEVDCSTSGEIRAVGSHGTQAA